MLNHHEVQGAQQAIAVREVRIVGELKRIRHRSAIAGDCGPSRGIGICRRLARRGRDRVLDRDDVTLDAVRALDRARERAPAQQASPTPRLGHGELKIPP